MCACVCVWYVILDAHTVLMKANKPETVSTELVVTVCSSLLCVCVCVCVCVCSHVCVYLYFAHVWLRVNKPISVAIYSL